MKTTGYPNRKLLPVGREGLEEGVEIIGDLVIEEYYEFLGLQYLLLLICI